MTDYSDIINLPHPEPKNHTRMSKEGRAAQFGAFRALTGHEEAIYETARHTDLKPELNENRIEQINLQLNMLNEKIDEKPMITLTYFLPDERKCGGEIITCCKSVSKLDLYQRSIIFADGLSVPFEMILNIDGAV